MIRKRCLRYASLEVGALAALQEIIGPDYHALLCLVPHQWLGLGLGHLTYASVSASVVSASHVLW